jgi:hypothetical protein
MMTRSNRRSLVVAGLVVFTYSVANGQDIPKVGQPTSGFYNARGNSVRVEWKLDRLTVSEDEELTATLVVSGVANPEQIIRPDLGKLRPFESRFVIAGDPTPPPIIGAKDSGRATARWTVFPLLPSTTSTLPLPLESSSHLRQRRKCESPSLRPDRRLSCPPSRWLNQTGSSITRRGRCRCRAQR